jgi:hypothetical protein
MLFGHNIPDHVQLQKANISRKCKLINVISQAEQAPTSKNRSLKRAKKACSSTAGTEHKRELCKCYGAQSCTNLAGLTENKSY